MANIKASKKDIRRNERNRMHNQAVKSRMKTYVKRTAEAIEAKNADAVKATLQEALREIDRAASKGVIHRNNAARKKSTLQREAAALLS